MHYESPDTTFLSQNMTKVSENKTRNTFLSLLDNIHKFSSKTKGVPHTVEKIFAPKNLFRRCTRLLAPYFVMLSKVGNSMNCLVG